VIFIVHIGEGILIIVEGDKGVIIYWLFSPASLFLASSTSAIPGSASFQRGRNFL
jgi:hypothetical protein